MANKKITELPFIDTISGSSVFDNPIQNTVVPVVMYGTTNQITIENYAKFINLYSAHTGSAGNTFTGPQTINNSVTINGRLTVHEIVAQYETSSILFSTGSTKLGDQLTDKHEFTGSTNITGALFYNNVLVTNIDSNTVERLQQATASLQTQTGSQDLVNLGISIYTGSQNVINTSVDSHILTQATQTGSQDLINNQNAIVTSSFRAEIGGIEAYTASLKGQAIVSSSTQITNYHKFAETASANTFYGNQSITGSLSVSAGEFNVTTGSGELTSSLSFRHTKIDPITGNAILELRYRNNDVGPENNAWKFMASDSGVALVFEQEGVDRTLLSSNNAGDALIFRDTRLFGKGLTVDNNLLVSQNTQITGSLIVMGGITGSILATNSVVSSSNQLFELNQQTGSQGNLNAQIGIATGSLNAFTSSVIGQANTISTFTASVNFTTQSLNTQTGSQDSVNLTISNVTASLRAEIGGIESYTASLKAAAIVSSSTQIQNYNLFALDANVAVKASGSTLYSTNPATSNFNQINSILLGGGAGQDATSAQSSIFLGFNAGIQATSAQESTFIGNSAGAYATNALRSNFFGINAGASAINAVNSNFIGYAAGEGSTNASYSTIIGHLAGRKWFGNGVGTNNIIIGTGITLENDRRDSINFGGIIFATGSYGNTGGNPFSGSVGNGRVGINKVLPSFELDISGSVGVTGSLKVSNGITGSLYSTNGVISSSNQLFELNNQTGSQDLVNLGISSVTGSLIGITNGLMAFTAALDSTYATDAQLYQLYAETASIKAEIAGIESYTASLKAVPIVSSSTQVQNYDVFALNSNLYNGTGSIKGEIAGIEAYTASLKGAAIVSSSQQITNYYKFAETASANTTFYGNVSASKFNVSTFGGTTDIYHTGGGHTVITNSTSNKDINYQTTGTGEHYFNSDVNITGGNLVIATSGNGIDFSATGNSSGTMTSELLNDYEEGTFTPIFVGTNLTISSYGNRSGYYTKIGRLVTVTIHIMTESLSVSGTYDVKIGGLPFTAANATESTNAANIFNSARWTANPPINADVNLNSTEINLYTDRGPVGAGTDPTTAKTTDMAIGSGNRNMVRLTATYFTA